MKMKLAFEVVGKGDPLVILHGLLGSADNWLSMSRRLGAHYQVFALDLRNHGRSPHSDILDYDVMVADVREFMEQQALRRIMLLGHSLGGKVAIQFAIDYSEQVDRLVIVDIAPKPYEPSQRYLLKAMRALDLTRYKSFADVDAALAPEVSSESLRQFLLKNLTRDENSRIRWKSIWRRSIRTTINSCGSFRRSEALTNPPYSSAAADRIILKMMTRD